jgi:hypothetical protein
MNIFEIHYFLRRTNVQTIETVIKRLCGSNAVPSIKCVKTNITQDVNFETQNETVLVDCDDSTPH